MPKFITTLSHYPGKKLLLIFFIVFAAWFTSSGQDTTKAEFKPSGRIWGQVFGDYYYKTHADSLLRGQNLEYSGLPQNFNAFAVRRIYLGFDYNLSEKLATELILSHESNVDAGGNRTILIKAANLRVKKLFGYSDLVIGQMATLSFALTEERIWGYRSVEKTIVDQRRLAPSSDMGIALQGKFDADGNYGYDVMIGNGSGVKPESDQFKRFYGDLVAKFFQKKLVLNIYADAEQSQINPYPKTKITYKAFAAWQSETVTLGVTYVMQAQQNYAIHAPDTISAMDTSEVVVSGLSVFVKGTILKDKLNFFARGDFFNPDNNFKSDNIYLTGSNPVTETFVTAGFEWYCQKNVRIIPNIWYDGFSSRAKNASGRIESDYDLVPRITVHYNFSHDLQSAKTP